MTDITTINVPVTGDLVDWNGEVLTAEISKGGTLLDALLDAEDDDLISILTHEFEVYYEGEDITISDDGAILAERILEGLEEQVLNAQEEYKNYPDDQLRPLLEKYIRTQLYAYNESPNAEIESKLPALHTS